MKYIVLIVIATVFTACGKKSDENAEQPQFYRCSYKETISYPASSWFGSAYTSDYYDCENVVSKATCTAFSRTGELTFGTDCPKFDLENITWEHSPER